MNLAYIHFFDGITRDEFRLRWSAECQGLASICLSVDSAAQKNRHSDESCNNEAATNRSKKHDSCVFSENDILYHVTTSIKFLERLFFEVGVLPG